MRQAKLHWFRNVAIGKKNYIKICVYDRRVPLYRVPAASISKCVRATYASTIYFINAHHFKNALLKAQECTAAQCTQRKTRQRFDFFFLFDEEQAQHFINFVFDSWNVLNRFAAEWLHLNIYHPKFKILSTILWLFCWHLKAPAINARKDEITTKKNEIMQQLNETISFNHIKL